jgi:hypothetical protein
MAETKIAALVTFSIFLLGSASGLAFNVQIDALTSASVKDINYKEQVDGVQSINSSVENTGSIGCSYRLKTDYSYKNSSFERYSSAYPLWPGEEDRARIDFLVENYTGAVQGNLSLEYCGQEQKVSNFSFNTSNITVEREYSSKTIDSNSSAAKIRIEELDEALLVPVEAPPYWKTASEEVQEGKAVIEYEAPIFDSRENISYAVVQNGEVLGETTVELEYEKTLWDRLSDVNPAWLYGLITVLAALNIFQYLRGRKAEN